jgi:hypothetical protein
MPRKRKSDQQSTETTTPPETTTEAAEPPAAEPTTSAASEQPAPEAKADGQNFADKVGQKRRVPDPDPFPVAGDTDAGVRLFQSKRDQWMAIMFGDGSPQAKPSQAILDKMHEAGWKWKSKYRIWALPFTPESGMRTHIEAERFYQDVCKMIRQEQGIAAGPGQGVPF